MKKNLKFLLLAPLLMAVLCDPNEDDCFSEDPESYVINVENISEVYAQNETIWLNANTSSSVVNNCTEAEDPEFVDDAQVFLDGIFILKLGNLSELNAEVVTDAAINYDIGEAFSFNACSEYISYLPELSDDRFSYEYRIGISIPASGDYCIVGARDSAFNTDGENNAQIFDAYNTLDDKIKFDSCDLTYTRDGTDDYYFFRVQ